MKIYDIQQRTYKFGLGLIKVLAKIPYHYCYIEIIRQLIRSGTSIGANVMDGYFSSSRKEFINYINIARKSAKESIYWLQYLKDLKILDTRITDDFTRELDEIIKIFSTIILKTKRNVKS